MLISYCREAGRKEYIIILLDLLVPRNRYEELKNLEEQQQVVVISVML